MQNPRDNKELMEAVHSYLKTNNLYLNEQAVFEWGIDCVCIFVDNREVLIVSLPPLSNYRIRETEYTDRYMRARQHAAV